MGWLSDQIGPTPFDQLNPYHPDNPLGETGQFAADPFDLLGERAGQTQEDISGILEESAQAGIDAQEARREQIRQLYEPWYNAAVNEGLPQLQAMANGGDIDYTPSRLYEYQKDRGERNINRQSAAGGLSESSARQENLSDFRLGLAQEEMDRLYAGQLSRVQLGSGASNAISAASQTLGGNVAGLYSNLGSGLNTAQQQYGEARQSSYAGLSSSLDGMSQYMEQGA
jgi:hypothetical protein